VSRNVCSAVVGEVLGRLVPATEPLCRAYISGLSTAGLGGGLTPIAGGGRSYLEGGFPLDAFSGYPVRNVLTSRAPGGTTGTLEVRPSRSSRTRDSSSQIPTRAADRDRTAHDVLNPARVPL